MAGEYYRWLAKDVKPEEKRELTREEKIQNWWYYHKWHVLIALVVIALVWDLGTDILTERKNRPDYNVAYVGSSYLPEDTVAQLTEALAQLGEDLNGNGKVQVALHQYIAYARETNDASAAMVNQSMVYSGQVQLAADFEECTSFFFLLEDPEQFQEDYGILVRPDGGFPEETGEGARDVYLAWSDCPVLTALPLGEFTVETMEKSYSGASQEALSGLYIGRRGFWQDKTCAHVEGCEALWSKLIRDAGTMP